MLTYYIYIVIFIYKVYNDILLYLIRYNNIIIIYNIIPKLVVSSSFVARLLFFFSYNILYEYCRNILIDRVTIHRTYYIIYRYIL